jgi:hypothetical protein
MGKGVRCIETSSKLQKGDWIRSEAREELALSGPIGGRHVLVDSLFTFPQVTNKVLL